MYKGPCGTGRHRLRRRAKRRVPHRVELAEHVDIQEYRRRLSAPHPNISGNKRFAAEEHVAEVGHLCRVPGGEGRIEPRALEEPVGKSALDKLRYERRGSHRCRVRAASSIPSMFVTADVSHAERSLSKAMCTPTIPEQNMRSILVTDDVSHWLMSPLKCTSP